MASRTESTRRRILLTGHSGFTGHYVRRELEAAGHEVIGLAQAHAGSGPVDGLSVDLLDRAALNEAVHAAAPDAVIHLAAIASVAHDDVESLYRVNVAGTRNLLAALASLAQAPRAVILASSANVYGNADVEPIDEDTPPAPSNDYAVSKLAMEHMARLWLDRLPITLVRPFNYTGVGQSVQFLIPKIVDHFRRGARVIELGNIDVARDFLDVRAVAMAYARLLARAPAGAVLNLCSGRAYTLAEVLAMMAEIAGYAIEVRVNPAFVRSHEVRRLVGSAARLHDCIGALPQITFVDTLRWMYAQPL
ncbi:MAG TPA: NAD-dependent epimerase/dehydratase family protein [Rhodanobacteraceae bacterium]|nr:NAD-dependent epimerase/dehydratase family protein [Rhodanobacteraceae bacterium]